MQLHEAGVGPEEPGGASGPSPPLLPAQVMVAPHPLLGFPWASRVPGDCYCCNAVLVGGIVVRISGAPLAPEPISPVSVCPCRAWGWPRLWRPC